MRYRLRTLLILLAVMPPMLWAAWMTWSALRPSPPPAEYNFGNRMDLDVF